MVEYPGLYGVVNPERVISHPDDVELFWYHTQHCRSIWCFVKPAANRDYRGYFQYLTALWHFWLALDGDVTGVSDLLVLGYALVQGDRPFASKRQHNQLLLCDRHLHRGLEHGVT